MKKIIETFISSLKENIAVMLLTTAVFFGIEILLLVLPNDEPATTIFMYVFMILFAPWYASAMSNILMNKYLHDEKPRFPNIFRGSFKMVGKFVGTAFARGLIFLIGLFVILGISTSSLNTEISDVFTDEHRQLVLRMLEIRDIVIPIWTSFMYMIYIQTSFVIIITKKSAFKALGITFKYLTKGGGAVNFLIIGILTVIHAFVISILLGSINQILSRICFALFSIIAYSLLYAVYRRAQSKYAEWNEHGIKFKVSKK